MKKILAVDDDTTLLESVNEVLSEEGYCTALAHDGKSLWKQIDLFHPDLVLLDIRLGEDDGSQIAKEIKEREQTQDIPIVLISANYNGRELSKKAGANAFLPKPFDINELSQTVKQYTN